MKKNINYLFYAILLTALVLLFVYCIWGENLRIPQCIFFTKFNIYCPGCGCTRAFIEMIHFNIIQSLIYNPGVIYYTIIISLYVIASILDIILKKDIVTKINMKTLFYIGIIILIITCIFKNIYFFKY